jgi:23S rRNA (uridine2552-2'-O)-methyltransferase
MRNMDYYSKEAKKQGYQARSVFKLEEIQKKFKIIKRNSRVLDIGCSPGSWSEYAIRKFNASVTGVDLKNTVLSGRSSRNFNFISGDIFTEEIEKRIMEYFPYDIVLSDAAPSTTGSRDIDSLRSCELGNRIFDLSLKCLKKGGGLVIKVFQGSEERDLLMKFKKGFESARAFKPKACRKESFETYFMGFKYL